jgi:hypothetical protein
MGLKNLLTRRSRADGTTQASMKPSRASNMGTQRVTKRSRFFGGRSEAQKSRRPESEPDTLVSDMTLFCDPASAPGDQPPANTGIHRLGAAVKRARDRFTRAGTGAKTGTEYTRLPEPTNGVSHAFGIYPRGPNETFQEYRSRVKTRREFQQMALQSTQGDQVAGWSGVPHRPVLFPPFGASQMQEIITAVANTYMKAASESQQQIFTPFKGQSVAPSTALPGTTCLIAFVLPGGSILPQASFASPSVYTMGPGQCQSRASILGQASVAGPPAQQLSCYPGHSVDMGGCAKTICGSEDDEIQSPYHAVQEGRGFAPSQAPSGQFTSSGLGPAPSAVQFRAGPSLENRLPAANGPASQINLDNWLQGQLSRVPQPSQGHVPCAREYHRTQESMEGVHQPQYASVF